MFHQQQVVIFFSHKHHFIHSLYRYLTAAKHFVQQVFKCATHTLLPAKH